MMQIVCPACATAYDVSAPSLGTAGRSVRCVRCRNVWFATPQPAEPVAAVATAPAEATAAREPETADADWAAWSEEAAAGAAEAALATASPDGEPGSSASPEGAAAFTVAPGTIMTADAPPIAPTSEEWERMLEQEAVLAAAANVETVAARRAPPVAPRHPFGALWPPRLSLSTAILALVAVNAALIGWRADVVQLLPQTGSLYGLIGLPVNLRGLAISDVKTAREAHDGVPVLVVEGTVANVSRAPVEVPRLRFAVRNEGGAEVYAWTALPAHSILSPGEQMPFSSRLASPPGEGREVVVRFFNRRDIAAGLR